MENPAHFIGAPTELSSMDTFMSPPIGDDDAEAGDTVMNSPNGSLGDVDAFLGSKHSDAVVGEAEFRWKIEDWASASQTKSNRLYSEPFQVQTGADGYWFSVLLMPKGQDRSDRAISLYLALDEQMNGAGLSGNEWSLCAEFILTIINPETGKSRSKYIHHRFDADAIDWGFSQFMFKDESEAEHIGQYVANNQVIIQAGVRILDDPTGMLWVSPASLAYDSKRATGCVGLQNQGATCYMNSILQSLFLTNAFRRSVFLIPTDGKDPHDSIPLALQRLFYALTFSSQPPNTNDLTASFGWDLHESFTQHDVQEFLRVLMDDLEEKFKGTSGDETIDRMFGGRVKKIIRCLDIHFESSRSETVYDVQLPVAGCPTLKDSFDAYIARETMTGDNKYMAEGHGLQDAEMFNAFDRLPPILHLILMRYRYDPYRDTTVKINDGFEFPEEVDLSPYMSDTAERPTEQHYLLHSVLVHSGDGHGGHYIAFIRPDPVTRPSFWLKFDDTRVVAVSKQEAVDDNFGGNSGPETESEPMVTRSRTALAPKLGTREAKLAYYKRVTNAYMLVYIRRSEASSILCPFTLADVPTHIIKQIEEEHQAEEARRQERLLQITTVKLNVYTPATIRNHPGYDLFCSEPHPACPITPSHSFRLKKELKVSAIIDQLKVYETDFVNGGRVWMLAHRRNRTFRMDSVVYDSAVSEERDVVSLGLMSDKSNATLLNLFAEPVIPELDTGCSTGQKSSIGIFFKLFDPTMNVLRSLGGLLVDRASSIVRYEPFIRKMMQMASTETLLEYYEEVKVGRVDKISRPERTFQECELQSGDILVVVPVVTGGYSLLDYYDTIQSMLQVKLVNMQSKDQLKRVDDFETVVSTKATVSELLRLIGDKVGWESNKIGLIPHSDSFSPRPAQTASFDPDSKWSSVLLGSQVVSPTMSVTVLYELLSIPLTEMANKRQVRVKDHEGVELQLWVDKLAPVSTILIQDTDLLKTAGPGAVHLYELIGSKIVKEVPSDRLWRDILNDELFIDRFPDLNPSTEMYIPGYLHHRDVPWGLPFMFKLIVGEPIGEMRKRIAARLGITSEREIPKLGIALSKFGRVQKMDTTDETVLFPEMRDLHPHEQLAVEQAERPRTPLDHAIKIKRTAPINE